MSQPIFILSHFRSGSTLLRWLLDAHHAVCCPAELRLGAVCQQVLKTVDLTSAVDDDVPAVRQELRLRATRRVVDALMDAYCAREGKDRWCDKSPGNIAALPVLASVFPDGQFLCLYRNALDQAHSAIATDGSRYIEPMLAKYHGNVMAAALDSWCGVVERLLGFEHSYPARAYRVRYEDVVREPEQQLLHISEFLNIAYVPNLSTTAFERRHSRGPADPKIRGANTVEAGRGGKGRDLDLSALPQHLAQRTSSLLQALGYRDEAVAMSSR